MIERPPSIVDPTFRTDEQGLTTARLFFEGGTWIQYRQASDGRLYMVIITTDSKTAHTTTTENEHKRRDHTDLDAIYESSEDDVMDIRVLATLN